MWRQHHYQGKPTWSGMHSSCNFPDAPLCWFHVFVLFFFFFFSQILCSGVDVRGSGGDGEGVGKLGSSGRISCPAFYPLSREFLLDLSAGHGE